jgi:hypothetical protein
LPSGSRVHIDVAFFSCMVYNMVEFGCCGWSVQIVRMTNLLVSVSDRAPEFSASILLGELNETLTVGYNVCGSRRISLLYLPIDVIMLFLRPVCHSLFY